MMTTFIFRVRNVPAALYKAMGGFATNGVNMTKLESYQLGGKFTSTLFYSDIEGHPDDRRVALALEELAFFSREVRNSSASTEASDIALDQCEIPELRTTSRIRVIRRHSGAHFRGRQEGRSSGDRCGCFSRNATVWRIMVFSLKMGRSS